MAKDKVAQAEAIAAMRASDGWQIVEAWIKEAIELTKGDVFRPKVTKNWNDYLHQRATHNAYVKLLFAVDRMVQDGLKEKEKNAES